MAFLPAWLNKLRWGNPTQGNALVIQSDGSAKFENIGNVRILAGLDNGSNLPGNTLQAQIDALIASGVPSSHIVWYSIGTEIAGIAGYLSPISFNQAKTSGVLGLTGNQLGSFVFVSFNNNYNTGTLGLIGVQAGVGIFTPVSFNSPEASGSLGLTGIQASAGNLSAVAFNYLQSTGVLGLTGVRVGSFASSAFNTIYSIGSLGLTGVSGGAAVSDDFNRANGSLGANWTTITSLSAPTITTNVVAFSGEQGSYYSGTTFTNDQYAECNSGVPFITDNHGSGVIVRCSSSVKTFYAALIGTFDDTEGGTYPDTIRLYKVINDVWTLLGSYVTTGSAGSWQGVIKLNAVGTTISVLTAPSHGGTYTQRISVTDSSITTGNPGLYNSMNTVNIDDFFGGNL